MSKYRYAKFMLYGSYMLFAWLIVDVVLVSFAFTSLVSMVASMVFLSFIFLLWFAYAYLVYDVAKGVLDTGYAPSWKLTLVVLLSILSMVFATRDPSSILGVIIDSLILFGAVGILFERTQDWE